ncbi:MAG TPA: Hsp20/alpha crystallin family protein [Afifellaceae bacterium]|nr:Hsp20/alpha crystallin family protein [Afifellaceae bacterium]
MTRSPVPNLLGDEEKGKDIFSSLHREIDRVFDDFTHGDHWPFRAFSPGNSKLSPRINVAETDKKIEVTAELPGVEEKDIDISLSDDMLKIKGEKKSETEKSEKDYHLVERSFGSFERVTRLPCEVDAEKVKAEFKQGILKISLPKSPTAQTKAHKIEISAK